MNLFYRKFYTQFFRTTEVFPSYLRLFSRIFQKIVLGRKNWILMPPHEAPYQFQLLKIKLIVGNSTYNLFQLKYFCCISHISLIFRNRVRLRSEILQSQGNSSWSTIVTKEIHPMVELLKRKTRNFEIWIYIEQGWFSCRREKNWEQFEIQTLQKTRDFEEFSFWFAKEESFTRRTDSLHDTIIIEDNENVLAATSFFLTGHALRKI